MTQQKMAPEASLIGLAGGGQRRRKMVAVIVGILSLALIGVSAMFLISDLYGGSDSERIPAAMDMQGNSVEMDEGVVMLPPSKVQAVNDDGTRLSVPAVGLDVPLGSLNAVDGVVTPPGFDSAYIIRNVGTAPSEPELGTLYVVMHSLRGGGVGPGNYLFDVESSASRLEVGDEISVGSLTYTVDSARRVAKDGLAATSEVWANSPSGLLSSPACKLPRRGSRHRTSSSKPPSARNRVRSQTLSPTALPNDSWCFVRSRLLISRTPHVPRRWWLIPTKNCHPSRTLTTNRVTGRIHWPDAIVLRDPPGVLGVMSRDVVSSTQS